MLEQKLTIYIECCAKCHQHQSAGHSQSAYQLCVGQIQNELSRNWKLLNMEINKKKSQPRIGAFEIIYDRIVLFSKLHNQFFPKPHDIAAMILSLKKKQPKQRQFIKHRLQTPDLYSYLRKTNIAIRLSLKQIHKDITKLIDGNKQNQIRPKSSQRWMANRKFFNIRENKAFSRRQMSIIDNIADQNSTSIARTYRSKNLVTDSIKKSSKLYSKTTSINDYIGGQKNSLFKSNRRPSYMPQSSLKKIKKYVYLSKQMDINEPLQCNQNTFEGQLLELSSSEEQPYDKSSKQNKKLSDQEMMKRRKQQGFSIALKSKQIGQGSRKYSFQFKKFTEDIEQKLREQHNKAKKKSPFREQKQKQSDSSDSLTQFNEKCDTDVVINCDEEEDEEWGEKLENSKQKIIEQGPVQEAQNSGLNWQIEDKMKSQLNGDADVVENTQYQEVQVDDANEQDCESEELIEQQISCITLQIIQQNTKTLQLIQWLCQTNQSLKTQIFSSNTLQNLPQNLSQFPKKYHLNIFNIKKGILQQKSIYISCEEQNKTHINDFQPAWVYIIFMAIFQQIKTYNPTEIVKVLTGCPSLLINTCQVKKVRKTILQNFFDKEHRIGKVYCIPGGDSQEQHVVEVVGYKKCKDQEWRYTKFTFINHRNEEIEMNYELLTTFFDSFLVVFHHPDYIHNQIQSVFEGQESQVMNPCWKIMFHNPEKSNIFISLTDWQAENRPTNIVIAHIKDAANLKSPKSSNKRNRAISKKNQQKIQIIGQINRNGTFFFEIQLLQGLYCCQIAKQFKQQQSNSLHFYSNSTITIIKDRLDYEELQNFIISFTQSQ